MLNPGCLSELPGELKTHNNNTKTKQGDTCRPRGQSALPIAKVPSFPLAIFLWNEVTPTKQHNKKLRCRHLLRPVKSIPEILKYSQG